MELFGSWRFKISAKKNDSLVLIDTKRYFYYLITFLTHAPLQATSAAAAATTTFIEYKNSSFTDTHSHLLHNNNLEMEKKNTNRR